MIGIIDYGMGNLYSVRNAFLSLGVKAQIISKPRQVRTMDFCVLPGVGAFGDAMDILNSSGMAEAIRDYTSQGNGFLGICLGLQLLFERSNESPGKKGLGLIQGEVLRFKGKAKIPHIGWNKLTIKKRHPILEGIKDGTYVYFCHSYYVKPKQRNVVVGETDYIKDYASVVAKDNVFGIQFHPEKSQALGLRILGNFAKLKI